MAKVSVSSIKRTAQKVSNKLIKELPKDKRTGINEKLIPYRTTGLGNLAIGAGLAGSGAIAFGLDAHSSVKARNLGQFDAQRLANQVGISPMTHSEEFIQGIPSRARKTVIGNVLNSPEEGYRVQGYNDLGAGGDLVFALNNLR